MLLGDKSAIVYGGGGAMGGAIARELAREGATVHLAGRTRAKMEAVAADITQADGTATVAEVDAFSPESVATHLAGIPRVDVSVNAVGLTVKQNMPMADLTPDEFVAPVAEAARMHFVTATAVARRMTAQGKGVIIVLSSSASREPVDLESEDMRPMIERTALRRLPLLAEVASTAAFVASDRAGAMTAAVVNLSCGAVVD